MQQKDLLSILEDVRQGALSPDAALLKIREAPYTDLDYAKVDNQRQLRQGVAEVIYGEGKTKEQIAGIAAAERKQGQNTILITRMDTEKAVYVKNSLLSQSLISADDFFYSETARIGIVGRLPEADGIGRIVIATGGTSDIPVAEEAALTAEALGNTVVRLYDVGVSGLHRLLDHLDLLMGASVIIAIAGMEGALASVIGGIADCPVIAVPTSVGYGANFGGLSALLSMLNSCASGVSVVNIDNGFGAGYQASMINHVRKKG